MTNEKVTNIWQDMPLACARAYEHLFYIKHDCPVQSILEAGAEGEGLDTVI